MLDKFYKACWENDITTIKNLFRPPFDRLLDSKAIMHIPNIFEAGFFEIADFLLYLPVVQEHQRASIVDISFKKLGNEGKLDLLTKFFNEPKYQQYLHEDVFVGLFSNVFTLNEDKNEKEVLSFLIFQANISEHNPRVQKLLNSDNYYDNRVYCEKLFQNRNLQDNLERKNNIQRKKI